MLSRVALSVVLLLAVPLFSQTDPRLKDGVQKPVWFQLTEDRGEVSKLLGKPANVASFLKDFVSWQFQLGSSHEDFSHVAVFRKSEGKLMSITREYEPESNVDELFPPAQTTACFFPQCPKSQVCSARPAIVRRAIADGVGDVEAGADDGATIVDSRA